MLLGCCALSTLAAWALDGSWPAAFVHLGHEAVRCLLAAPLVIFVTSITASSRHMQAGAGSKVYRTTRQLFFATKTTLALLLTCLLSADLCRPLSTACPAAGTLLQILCFVVFTIFALRWAFRDQEGRCKQCLRALAGPARVGRPSRNLLEWNGTAQVCRLGHGMLSVPEMETSWCQYSQWFDQQPEAWDQTASV